MGTNKLIFLISILFIFAFTVDNTNIGTREISVTAYGFSKNNTAAQNTQAVHDAIQDANGGVFKRIVSIPKGTFSINNITIDYDGVTIVGSGKPLINGNRTGFIDGSGTSTINGRWSINNKRGVTISNLGIDVSNVSARDAITGGTQYVANQNCKISNVSMIGSGSRHGVVFPFGDGNMIEGLESYYFDHAWACRGSYNMVSNWYSWDCDVTGGIFKSIGTVDAVRNIATNGIIEGSSIGSTGGIFVNGFTPGTKAEFNHFTNVTMKFPNYGIRCNGDGDTNYNKFTNISIERPQFNGVLVQDSANENIFNSILVVNPVGPSFEIDGTGAENDLIYCSSSGAATDIQNGTTPFRTQLIL